VAAIDSLSQRTNRSMTYKPRYSVPEIVRMHGEGLTHREIGRRAGISSSRVGQLICKSTKTAGLEERARSLREELRSSNDCARKLPFEDVLCLLDLSGIARNRLRKWCVWEGIKDHLRDEGGFYPYILNGRGAALLG